MEMILTGTGTSHGVPVIGCNCKVCRSRDKKDKRLRCSAYLKAPVQIVIDTGPEFRIQALKYGITRLDAVLLTHSHADHIHGLDDVRVFSHTASVDPSHKLTKETEGEGLPVYTNANTIRDTENRFDYIFKPVKEGGGKPKLKLTDIGEYKNEPLMIGPVEIREVPILHGTLNDCGWLFSQYQKDGKKHSIAYLTDCNQIPDESVKLILENAGILDFLVIDALRVERHSTHFSFREAMEASEKIGAKHTYFTHMTHNMKHREIKKYIAQQLHDFPVLESIVKQGGCVEPAYDGLVLNTDRFCLK